MKNLHKRRQQILNEMAQIRTMRQGQLSKHYLNKKDDDGEITRYGPYYLWQSWREEKQRDGSSRVRKQSVRVSNTKKIKQELDNYKKFKKLAREFMDVTEKITLLSQ